MKYRIELSALESYVIWLLLLLQIILIILLLEFTFTERPIDVECPVDLITQIVCREIQ